MSDNLRDELGRVAFDLARNRPCDDRTWELVKGNKKLLFWPTADAFMAVVERRVAEAKAEAWDEGYESAHAVLGRHVGYQAQNPYRQEGEGNE